MQEVKIDITNPEAAAVAVAGIVGDITAAVAGEFSGADRAIFMSSLSGRVVGTLAAVLGVDEAMALLDGTAHALRKAAPQMRKEAAAARGVAH